MPSTQPENIVLQNPTRKTRQNPTRNPRADVDINLHCIDSKIDVLRRDFSDQIVGFTLRRREYCSGAIGHGNLIADLEVRMKRVE